MSCSILFLLHRFAVEICGVVTNLYAWMNIKYGNETIHRVTAALCMDPEKFINKSKPFRDQV